MKETLLVNVQGPSTYPQLGCAYLLSSLRQAGHEAEFLDLAFVKNAAQGEKALLDRLATGEFALVGFSLNESKRSFEMAFELAKKVKSCYGLYVVFGGALFGYPELCEEYLSLPFVDSVAGGEGELTFPRLVGSIVRGKKLDEVLGLFTKTKDGCIVQPKTRSLIESLDTLPYLCYDDFDLRKYSPALPVLTTRGCPWGKCRFCNDISGATCQRMYRERSAEHVVGELDHLKRKYPSTKVFAWHDQIMCYNLPRFQKIMTLMRESNLDIYWAGEIYSMPSVTKGVLERMYSTGCRAFTFGVESGSQNMLRRMLKGTSARTNERIIRDAHETGLKVRTTWVVYYPGESAKDVEETIDFLRKNIDYIDSVQIHDFELRLGSCIQQHLAEYLCEGFFSNVQRIPFTTHFTFNTQVDRKHVECVQRLKEFVADTGKNRELTICGYNLSYFESMSKLKTILYEGIQAVKRARRAFR
ncbi:MAG: radical SAM protein [Candidatus Bathyarchaeia archaeon]